jgi:hypothetical protein
MKTAVDVMTKHVVDIEADASGTSPVCWSNAKTQQTPGDL